MDLIGQQIDQYRIIELIGQGGMGGMATVYKAHQASLNRYVAIKVLLAQHIQVSDFKERFLREAKTIAQLSHPNILPIYDVNFSGDISYLVMKYVRGPFYPAAQRDLDRMGVQGIIQVINFESKLDDRGAWTNADYQLTGLGFNIIKNVIGLPTVLPIWEFLQDLAIAYSHVENETRDAALLKDRTYDLPGKSNMAVMNFEKKQNNRSLLASNTFVELAPEWLRPGRQDRLRMYLKYLELRVA